MSALDALTVVTAQVEAFNTHDLEGFVATYSPDAVITGLGDELVVGRDAIRSFYEPRLSDPTMRCDVESTVLFGDRWVIAQEFVSKDGAATETIATFDVSDGLIQRASLVKA